MNFNEIQNIIDAYDYWDSAVKKLECSYFADEVVLMYDSDEEHCVTYNFFGCYKSIFDHVKGYDKRIPVKSMEQRQLPYFLQNVKISETELNETHFFVCRINMFPLELEIWCKDIQVTKQRKSCMPLSAVQG
jgi:hypothetical protein